MERLLLTVGRKRCPFRCTYCFTDFSQYERPLTIEEVEGMPNRLRGIDVVYPACDVDLFALKQWPRLLRRAAALGPSISISTKAALDREAVRDLAEIARDLESRGMVLKIGVSISTSSRCDELEPHAPGYRRRLETLERLALDGIPSALILRPLLVDVAPNEYEAIVADASPFTDLILTGPEHLDNDQAHSRHHPRAPHPRPRARPITWAVNKPHWASRSAPAQERAARRAATKFGLKVFDTDLSLMAYLIYRGSSLSDDAATG